MKPTSDKRLIIVSNRLPVSLKREGKHWAVTSSSGGLVTAMGPVLQNRGGLWIGWPGVSRLTGARKILNHATRGIGYTLVPVNLSQDDLEQYYYGFSNEIIWPLFHGLHTLCNYDPAYWEAYRRVSRKFAKVISEETGPEDYLWIHDYQIMNVGEDLRAIGMKTPIGFFLHIPFPGLDLFQKLPWRRQILKGLLAYDLVGFQTVRHKRNFIQCLRGMLPEIKIFGKGNIQVVRLEDREVRIGHFPIGIDFNTYANGGQSQEVEAEANNLSFALRNRTLILGVDRLDYTKGIPYKLNAMRIALSRFPELLHKVNMVQVVVPSRQEIPQYELLKNEIEQLVGEINGQYAQPGWVPIQYIYRSLSRTELLAFYRAADIAMITPLDDGMNLVAKEYCAVNSDGVLVLSEFAGAAHQLHRGALLVNPYDLEGVADAIYQAYKMDPRERTERMSRLRRIVQQQDVFRWVSSFLQAGIEQNLADFPQQAVDSDSFDETFWAEID
ncbi:MAG: trehalose-6-phosphate synthase [bacterium]